MKKITFALFCLFAVFTLVACDNQQPCDTCPEIPGPEDLTPSPIVTPVLHHWMPGALLADVTATVDVKNASTSSVQVTYETTVLENYVDYELSGTVLSIAGHSLVRLGLDLGEHIFYVNTEHGRAQFPVTVVDDPRNTSIPMKTIKGVDMSQVPTSKPTAVIAGAPRILVTEISSESSSATSAAASAYDYVEIFNNSTEELNLKGYRYVWGFANNVQNGLLWEEHGIIGEPYGMVGACYIYQDYIVPALTSAVLWINNTQPWNMTANATPNPSTVDLENPDFYRDITIHDDVETMVVGTKPNNLSVEKFRTLYGLPSSALVFHTRTQLAPMNNAYSYDPTTGFGNPISKLATANWHGSRSTSQTMFQIWHVDQTTLFDVGTATTGVPVGATHYRYEMGVLNQEEVVFPNGEYKEDKLMMYGRINAVGDRQSKGINIVYARKVFTTATGEFVGYATTTAQCIDIYNVNGIANKPTYRAFVEEAVTPIVTAFVYPRIEKLFDEESGDFLSYKLTKWGSRVGVEYTIPSEGSIIMRLLPRDDSDYTGYYVVGTTVDGLKALIEDRIASIAPAVGALQATQDIIVPENAAYPIDYISSGFNSAGRTHEHNFK